MADSQDVSSGQLTLEGMMAARGAAIEVGVEEAWEAHGYLDEHGDRDPAAVQERVLGVVKDAVARTVSERAGVAITRKALVRHIFPEAAGPPNWDEADDPAVAEGVHKKLDEHLWRLVTDTEDGAIQGRLNSEVGLVLCRTTATPEGTAGVYVTDAWECLLADYAAPEASAVERAVAKHARKARLVMSRLPQHAKRSDKQLREGVKRALEGGVAITAPALEVANEATAGKGSEE